MRWPSTLLLIAILPACTSSSSPAGGACAAAGGRCVLGGAPCSKQAATSAQDCNPPPENPGGAFCCLDLVDVGVASGEGGGSDALAAGDSSLPACKWPASLDRPDVYTTACVAARTCDVCETLDGGGSRCGINACNADEYAVSCGGPGPAQPPPLPADCRSAVSGPGGGVSGCCPCGD